MWPWQRKPEPRPKFDAIVDLGPSAVDGLQPAQAMIAAEQAVRGIAGAAQVRIRLGNGPARVRAQVFPPGQPREREGEPWAALRTAVEAAAAAALRPLTRAPVSVPVAAPVPFQFATPVPHRGDFREGPQQFDALAELAALAQSISRPAPLRRSPPPVSQPPTSPDSATLARLLAFVLPADGDAAAAAAVRRFGSYAAVLAASERDLRAVPGLGPHCVAAIKLFHEASVRLTRAGVTGAPVLDDPARLTAYLTAAIGRAPVEQFRILFLDARGMLQADEVQAIGTVNHTPVYPREVARRAMELKAASVILVHNHPTWMARRTLSHA